jgi:hypothetical protein
MIRPEPGSLRRRRICMVVRGISTFDHTRATSTRGRGRSPATDSASGGGCHRSSYAVAFSPSCDISPGFLETSPRGSKGRMYLDEWAARSSFSVLSFSRSKGGAAQTRCVEQERAEKDRGKYGLPWGQAGVVHKLQGGRRRGSGRNAVASRGDVHRASKH